MHGGDGGHEREAAGTAQGERCAERREPRSDPAGVPTCPVLIGQQHGQTGRVDPRSAPRVGEQDQREQPGDLRLLRQQAVQHRGELQGPLDQPAPNQVLSLGSRVAGREHEMHDVQHRVEALGQLVRAGHAIRDPSGGDLLLRAGDPRGHRRLADEERAGDLGRGQAAHHPQGQRDASLQGQRRVAAAEDQAEPVVGEVDGVGLVRRRLLREQPGKRVPRGRRPSSQVQRTPAGSGGEPGARVGRYPPRVPGRERGRVRVLHRFLGDVPVGRDPSGGGQHESPLTPVRIGDGRGDLRAGRAGQLSTRMGRTSTPPNGAGTSFAIASASSRSAASIT